MGDKKKEINEQQRQSEQEKEYSEGGGQASHDNSQEQNTSDADVQEVNEKIERLEKERDELKDKYLRKAAEFENYKRRTEQEFTALSKYANEQLISDLLPIIDDFERSLTISKDRREFGPFYKGIELIYQKFIGLLNAKGVQPIDSEGKQFNVDLHDALMQVPKEDVEPNTIIEEVEKGYLYKDKVIRHAKVVVAKEAEDDTMNDDKTSRENIQQRGSDS